MDETQARLVRAVQAIETPGFALIAAVHGPVGFQGLPDVMSTWFAIDSGQHRKRYGYPSCEYGFEQEGYVDSSFSFEADAHALDVLLGSRLRIAWSAGMRILGVQVPSDRVAETLGRNLFNAHVALTMAPHVRFAFSLNNDINELTIFLDDHHHPVLASSLEIGPSDGLRPNPPRCGPTT